MTNVTPTHSTPFGPLSKRTLHFIWLLDRSASMASDGKIQALNAAITESLPAMTDAAAANQNAKLLVRAVSFGEGAEWHVAEPTPPAQFGDRWQDLIADGRTNLGAALKLVNAELHNMSSEGRVLPPVLVLLSDGYPSDSEWRAEMQKLLRDPIGKIAVRIAIAIGKDAEQSILQEFIANPEIKPMYAGNPKQLVDLIQWASVALPTHVSTPTNSPGVPIPPATPPASSPFNW